MDEESTRPIEPEKSDAKNPLPIMRAEDLFGKRREIWIELAGERYRLRITRRNKLVLQK